MKRTIAAGIVSAGILATGFLGIYPQDPLYPNKELTPGSILTADAKVVCVPGYTKTVRSVPESLKRRVLEEYGLSYPADRKMEIDHLISLELGGSNDIKNLWPEIGPVPNKKDRVENDLHRKVCKGDMLLTEAQRIISTDWYSYYLTLK